MASTLPLKPEDIDHLDKASVMRLSIAYLNVQNMLDLCKLTTGESNFELFSNLSFLRARYESFTSSTCRLFLVPKMKKSAEDKEESKDVKMQVLSKYVEEEKLAFTAMDGFLLVLNDDGDITYVSENISEILGLSMVKSLPIL